ncbi:MAG: YkvA family protein [Leptolyngbyaceae cyanobacterium bins.349]|nr:YkvA family protein [Leptolyngbyaceae cyanobacterium bins.349]
MKRSFVRTFTNWIYTALRSVIRHPKYRWWAIAGSLVYLLNPFDIAPDALPIVGWIDDGLLATIVITEVSQLLNDHRKAQKHKKTQSADDVAVVDAEVMPLS